MFGDLMGMMGKLKETQQKVEETKKRLDTISVEEQSSDKLIRVVVSANKQVQEIQIEPEIFKNGSDFAEKLKEVLNKALEEAGKIQEAELSAVAKEGLPNIPGLDKMFR